MTYRFAVAGMLWAVLVLGGGCASTPAAGADPAVPTEEATDATPKAQPKVLERSAPSAKEIETPLQGNSAEALPVLAQGATPVGEGGTPRSNPPTIPAARPGDSPAVAEIIDIPTTELHGGTFPGVGATPKTGNGNGKPANAEVLQRISTIEQQLDELHKAATQAPAAPSGPDLEAFNAVRARLDELATKVDGVAAQQHTRDAKPPNTATGVSPERVDTIEREIEALRAVAATREDLTATDKERALAGQAYVERLAGLEKQLADLNGAVAKNTAGVRGKGLESGELSKRMDSIDQQLKSLRDSASKSTAPSGPDPAAFSALQSRLDEISAKLNTVEGRQADLDKHPAQLPASTGVSPERVEAIEREIGELRSAAAKPVEPSASEKDREATNKAFAARMSALEEQLGKLGASIEKSSARPAESAGLSSTALAERLDVMQQQLDAAQLGWEAAAKAAADATPTSDPGMQARIEALSATVERIQQDQAKRPASESTSVPEARFAQIEQQIAAIQQSMISPKSAAPSAGLDGRFGALEKQLDGLRGELAAQSKALAEAKALNPGGVDGSVHAALSPGQGDYRIGAGDKVEFQSFNDEKISREELTVRFDGYISLPLIPDVAVGNLTRSEAEERIREEYRSIFRDPQIALIVREATSKTYTIVGDIEKPGVFPFSQSTSLIEAISMAGGLRRRSSSSSVGGFVGVTGQLTKAFIVRMVEGEREVLQYDLRGLGKSGAHDSQVPIQYGDLIYVPEGVNLVYLLGESRNPVIVELTEGMKLLQLLSLAGGFDASTARLNGVVLMRQTDENNTRILKLNVKEILRTGKDIELVPGDIVYIPRKRLIALQEFVQRFTGTISPVLDLYTSAVDAYYAVDLQRSVIKDGGGNRTLEVLQNLEGFGSSTANIVDLFRRP